MYFGPQLVFYRILATASTRKITIYSLKKVSEILKQSYQL